MASEAVFRIRGEDAGFSSTMDRAEERMKKFEASGGSMIGTLGKLAAAFYIVRHAVHGLTSGMEEALEKAHKFAIISERIGMPADKVAQLGELADESGTSIESIGKAIMNLQKWADQGIGGTNKKVTELAERLGISRDEMERLRLGGGDALGIVADKLRDINDEGERNALTTQLMGKKGYELSNILSMTSDQIKKSMDKQIALTQEQINSLNPIKEVMHDIGDTWTSVSADMMMSLDNLLPPLTSILFTMIDLANVVSTFFSKTQVDFQAAAVLAPIYRYQEKYADYFESQRAIQSIRETGLNPMTGTYYRTEKGRQEQIESLQRQYEGPTSEEEEQYERNRILYEQLKAESERITENKERSRRTMQEVEDRIYKRQEERLARTAQSQAGRGEMRGTSAIPGIPTKAEEDAARKAYEKYSLQELGTGGLSAFSPEGQVMELDRRMAELRFRMKAEKEKHPGAEGFESAEYQKIEKVYQEVENRKTKVMKMAADQARASEQKDMLMQQMKADKLFNMQIEMDKARGVSAEALHLKKMMHYEDEHKMLEQALAEARGEGASDTEQRRIIEAINRNEEAVGKEKLSWLKTQMASGQPGGVESIQTIGGGGRAAMGGIRAIMEAQLEVQHQIAANTAPTNSKMEWHGTTPKYAGPLRSVRSR